MVFIADGLGDLPWLRVYLAELDLVGGYRFTIVVEY
jgi:hypothetical protein